jgi:hypothetical protein
MPGSTKVNHQGAVFYKRPPAVSFAQSSLPALVSMKDGHFQFAIIASCGNPVSAAPTPQPHVAVGQAKVVSKPPHKPQPQPTAMPAPTQSQTQSQSQSQEVNVNNININSNTQITKQAAPQPATKSTTVQPSVQHSAATLPNTGPTGVIGAFLIAVGVGTLGYRRLLLSRIKI